MKSHAILKTNVGLTTNAKIMVTGSYSLYVDAIISNAELSSTKYNKMEFNKDNLWDEVLPYFFKGTPVDIAFFIKDDFDYNNMSNDFSKQYDDLYEYGARNIIENKDYSEEFEYFAPLHISKVGLPEKFIIFRIDGPGLVNSNKDNFRSEIINKLKCVKIFDLTKGSLLGEWLEKNITKNKSFPNSSLYIDFRNLEFSSWNGIDYEDGGYSERTYLLDSTLNVEQLYQDFEKFVLDSYKNNKIVYPHILNLSFLFDDTPATPTSIRTWSINRYLGFYMDSLEFVKNVSPYILPSVRADVVIDSSNIIYSISQESPFEQTFKNLDNLYIEIGGEFFKVERYLEQQPTVVSRVEIARNTFEDRQNQTFVTKFKIIANKVLAGRQSEINKNIIVVDSSTGSNKITDSNGNIFQLEGYDDADVWLIEIDGNFHNLIKGDDDNLYINTDYSFFQSIDKFEYYINDPDPNFRKSLSLLVDAKNPPKTFGIYKCRFTEIKDFDVDILDTEYSKFEYSYKEKLTDTDESKMYAVNQDSNVYPKDFDDFKLGGSVVNIPTSSEYVANSELFRVRDQELNILWKKNSKRIKWGFQNSISSNDYPYLLNNSFTSEDFNRTVNPFYPQPSRQERNLDYFLTLNPNSNEYLHHSLHIVDDEVSTFSHIDEVSTLTRLNIVSNIGYYNIGDIISISSSNTYYNTDSKIKDIRNNGSAYSIIIDLIYQPITSTVSGSIKNVTRSSFDLSKYLNINYELDYFNYLFSKKNSFDNGAIVKNSNKYSTFNTGDSSTPNITLFRGLKFKIWDVVNVKINADSIETINTKTTNSYDNYKFGILLSKNNYSINTSVENNTNIGYNSNHLKWEIIDVWKLDKIYQKDEIVTFYDMIYISNTQSQTLDPNIFPYNSSDWQIWNFKSIFWNNIIDGSDSGILKNNMFELGKKIFDQNTLIPPLVYNYGEYYYSNGTIGNNFWSPGTLYSQGSVVLFQNKIWISQFDDNDTIPSQNGYRVNNGAYELWWTTTSMQSTIWETVELWNEKNEYLTTNSNWNTSTFTPGHYVVYEDVVYVSINDTIKGQIPPQDPNWKRVYSLVQDTKYYYNFDFRENKNPIINMNNRLYLCRENGYIPSSIISSRTRTNQSTLENGINIYINKKWKNVFVNIYVNDNTYTSIQDLGLGNYAFKKDRVSNTNRDDVYSDIFSKLTANNFINAINDVTNFYEFSDKIRYIIINEDLSIKSYDFNDLNTILNLPVLLTCDYPDEFLVRINSISVKPISIPISEIKPKRQLLGGEINSLSELNYYSEISLATNIVREQTGLETISNYSGLKNNLYNKLFRHSGEYSPIFNSIELFRNATLTQSGRNYKFDTDLTFFGKIKERIISKINRRSNILKFKDKPELNSIYPMIDEFGYHVVSSYIFKSSWDVEYHIECNEIPQTEIVSGNQSIQFSQPSNITNTINLNLL